MFWTPILLACVAALVLVWMLRGAWGRRTWRRRIEQALESLQPERDRLEQAFLQHAPRSGIPRGLLWKSCRFHETALLVRDRATSDLYALVGATIAFEAVEGGEMEDVAAVSNLRCATALLEWRDQTWIAGGRVLFNLEPAEAVRRYHRNLERITEVAFNAAD